MSTATTSEVTETHVAGRIGLVCVVGLAVVLGVHPFGSSDLYDDGQRFLDHVGWYWVALHFVGTLLLLTWSGIIATWAKNLATVESQFIARLAAIAAATGMGVGALHLIATDTMTFLAFSDTFEAGQGSEATLVGADLLVRLHAATLAAWVLSFWLAVPLLLGWACLRDPRLPLWAGGLALAAALLQTIALSITIAEQQWTTASEMGFFRIGATLFIGWMIAATFSMRRGDLWVGVAAP